MAVLRVGFAPVFGNHEGAGPSPNSISDHWCVAMKNRELPGVTFRALHHCHASALIAAGVDVFAVGRRLGHACSALTLSVYGHLFRNDDDSAASAIDAALAGGLMADQYRVIATLNRSFCGKTGDPNGI